MRNFTFPRICLLALSSLIFFSCKNEVENFSSDDVKDYIPLATGKYITYRLDSTVFTDFGRSTALRSYQVKHVVDQQITDNQGRPAYRIFRYRRDLVGTQNWEPYGTYTITQLGDQVEVTEDNFRYIKLHMPVRQDFSWPGNTYLPFNPYDNLFQFSNDDFMDTWNYYYENIHDVFKYNQQNLTDVVSVLHIDERIKIDTVDVISNRATIPKNVTAVYLRGTGTDTVKITAQAPDPGKEELVIYNQTNIIASLNGIAIPAGLGFNYQYANGKWFYPNNLVAPPNPLSLPRTAYSATITGAATDTIKINTAQLDTFKVKSIKVYNYNTSTNNAYCNFNAAMNALPIPPGFGRQYELFGGNWRMYNNSNVLLTTPNYIESLAFGSTNYSIEKFAKNIGLVYKEFLLWEYQPNTGGQGGPYTTGFGIKMTMIDHN
jgi:hypothetical protein